MTVIRVQRPSGWQLGSRRWWRQRHSCRRTSSRDCPCSFGTRPDARAEPGRGRPAIFDGPTVSVGITQPYLEAAPLWLAAGWPSILPVPHGRKSPPPAGYTGADGLDPTHAQMTAWMAEQPRANAALRLPRGVIGLDVDDYGDKVGRATWEAHCARYGDPPPTWVITSRREGLSGIRLYRCTFEPDVGALDGGDVEIIRFGHRYALLPPSMHPEGRKYELWSPDGQPAAFPPLPGDLPSLPPAWGPAIRARAAVRRCAG